MLVNACELALLVLLLVGAGFDLFVFRLPNWLTLATALAATLLIVARGTGLTDLAWHLGFAALVFGIGLVLFRLNMFGGGDVKWLAALAIWIGPNLDFVRFFLMMGIAGGVLAAIVLVIRRLRPGYGSEGTRTNLPYGVAIAVAGLEFWLRKGAIAGTIAGLLAG